MTVLGWLILSGDEGRLGVLSRWGLRVDNLRAGTEYWSQQFISTAYVKAMAKVKADSLYGMVDVLLLKTLSQSGVMHGLAISQQVSRLSDDFLQLEEGALYPALHRLQKRGLIEGEWKISDKRRRAKFYTLTSAGRRELRKEVENWVRQTSAVRKVLEVGLPELG